MRERSVGRARPVWIKECLPQYRPAIVEIQAGCSFSHLTYRELVALRDALSDAIRELDAEGKS